jgi:hypothetical protein
VAQFLYGVLSTLLALAALAGYVWHFEPERLPAEWRRGNPHSRDYTPVLYRWKDAAGVVQVTDRPPPDRPYETVRIDPNTNRVPLQPRGNGGE